MYGQKWQKREWESRMSHAKTYNETKGRLRYRYATHVLQTEEVVVKCREKGRKMSSIWENEGINNVQDNTKSGDRLQ